MKIISLFKLLPVEIAYAHCDIPCGIYDPNNLQMASHTIYRMTDMLIDEEDIHQVARYTNVKEKHSDIIEEELATLADDYFKEEHYKKYKNLEKLFEDAKGLSVKSRQNIDLESANNLIEKVLEIAEIFYDSKGVESKRVKSVYPTGLEIVVQK